MLTATGLFDIGTSLLPFKNAKVRGNIFGGSRTGKTLGWSNKEVIPVKQRYENLREFKVFGFGNSKPEVVKENSTSLESKKTPIMDSDDSLIYKEAEISRNRPKSAKSGETLATRSGKEIHKNLANERRSSDMFDLVNEPITDLSGHNIEVAKSVNLKTGEPVARKGVQTANPDAVKYNSKLILDDKPLGRNVLVKDRQEIIRFIKAYEKRTGELPNRTAIQRYDPETGQPVKTDLYSPEDFLPGEE